MWVREPKSEYRIVANCRLCELEDFKGLGYEKVPEFHDYSMLLCPNNKDILEY